MTFDERVSSLLIGLFIGFILGYITRSLKKIERKVDDVDRIVKERNEQGFMRFPLVNDIMVLLIVLISVFAAFQTQKVNNDLQSTQDTQRRITVCAQEALTKTIRALNERTEYTIEQSAYNVDLQTKQAEFLRLALIEPPLSDARLDEGLSVYVDSLTEFIEAAERTRAKQIKYPYPTENEFQNCVSEAKEK